ncbi:hypothetical protein QBC36DRAFT_365837 [Triangularia setosa]|uniref:Uncharacterized protein n=1 Tax=Triangularia setosa TaxID=2587417 RepID=A0AAN6WBJ1_9PEZI|nr:hypothetical protein QBC36DRAFT_365837 [Podospora setosa]
MSNMARNRVIPALIASGLFGGLLYSTAGGSNQPRPRARHDAGGSATDSNVSESLQQFAGTGGKHARKQSDIDPATDPKNTHIVSHSSSPHSKRSPQKKLDFDDGAEAATPPKNVGPEAHRDL